MIDETGVVTGITLIPASVSEREAAWDLIAPIKGCLLGDKGHLGVDFKKEMKKESIEMISRHVPIWMIRSPEKRERPLTPNAV
ncbi:hypothetical protein [Xenorhabdus sp. SGI246]|uniref:hypothetical protein n=1 Tax=Xenorhabdus sp. SGI246 TaxID=3158263 RepID=UPI00349F6908